MTTPRTSTPSSGAGAWAGRLDDQRRPLLATIAFCVVGIGGKLLAPAPTAAIWSTLLSVGLGAGQGIPGILYVRRAAHHHQTAQLSGMAQSIGYLVAAAGPFLACALHARAVTGPPASAGSRRSR